MGNIRFKFGIWWAFQGTSKHSKLPKGFLRTGTICLECACARGGLKTLLGGFSSNGASTRKANSRIWKSICDLKMFIQHSPFASNERRHPGNVSPKEKGTFSPVKSEQVLVSIDRKVDKSSLDSPVLFFECLHEFLHNRLWFLLLPINFADFFDQFHPLQFQLKTKSLE